jgi:hypothetical protein
MEIKNTHASPAGQVPISWDIIPLRKLATVSYGISLTGGQEAEKAYVVGDTECGTKKR